MYNSFNNNEGERRPRPRFQREAGSVSARPRFRREDGEARPKPFGFNSERSERSERPFGSDRPQRSNKPFGGKPKRNNGLYSARKQLDEWTKGQNPKLLMTPRGKEHIYTEI